MPSNFSKNSFSLVSLIVKNTLVPFSPDEINRGDKKMLEDECFEAFFQTVRSDEFDDFFKI